MVECFLADINTNKELEIYIGYHKDDSKSETEHAEALAKLKAKFTRNFKYFDSSIL